MTRFRQRVHKSENSSSKHFHGVNHHQQQHSIAAAGDNHNDTHKPGYYDEGNNEYLMDIGSYLSTENLQQGTEFIFVPPHVINFLFRQLVYSRLILLFFQCAINCVMRDAATDAFKGINTENQENENWLIRWLFSGLSCWDARHFLHIAEFGYVWESNLAFFPLFPMLLRILGTFMQHFVGQSVSLFSAMLLSGVIFNNILFVLNGLLIFRLILLLNGGNLKEAILAVYIHCWCPASVFYSALYTESLYSTFTLFGLLHLYSSQLNRQNLLVTSAVFSLAFLTRSNGLTNVGFIGFQLLLDSILVRMPTDLNFQFEFREPSWIFFKRLIKNFLFFILCFAIMSMPLRVFEFAVYDKFCLLVGGQYVNEHVVKYLRNATIEREIVLPGQLTKLHWCNESFTLSNLLLPAYYPYIQQKYWDVGLFSYWQWRKLPLFLMAAPTLWFAFYGFIRHTFGLLSDDLRPIPDVLADKRGQIPFACHILLLAISGLIFYNVEVSIRLLFSASPFLYMVLARLICAQTQELQKIDDLMHSPLIPFLRVYMHRGLVPFLVFSYLFGYFIFGTMLHVNWFSFV